MKIMLGWRHSKVREDSPSLMGSPALVSLGIYLVWFFYNILLDGVAWVLVLVAPAHLGLSPHSGAGSVSCLGGRGLLERDETQMWWDAPMGAEEA